MGWFDKNPLEEQIETYEELLEEKQNQFDELKDVNTGAAQSEREALRDQMAELNISLQQTRDQITHEEGQSLNDMGD